MVSHFINEFKFKDFSAICKSKQFTSMLRCPILYAQELNKVQWEASIIGMHASELIEQHKNYQADIDSMCSIPIK